MKYIHNISYNAIAELIIHFNDKHPYGTTVEKVAEMLNENILGSTEQEWTKFIIELATESKYFYISNGKIIT